MPPLRDGILSDDGIKESSIFFPSVVACDNNGAIFLAFKGNTWPLCDRVTTLHYNLGSFTAVDIQLDALSFSPREVTLYV